MVMKIGIVGWGVEGQSAFRYYGASHEYLICNEEPRDDFPMEDSKITVQFINAPRAPGMTSLVADLNYLNGLEYCDKIIYSVPAAKNLEKKFGRDTDFWSKAVTIQHIFFQQVRSRNIIGVTGTKGKGTTSTLITLMLKEAGKKVFLGGNIGVPVLDFLNDVMADDWVILELSSFQLYNLTYSPHIGVCLMVVPEHMDWHTDMADYAGAKANLFRHQKPEDFAIYYADNENSTKIAGYSPGKKIPYFRKPGAYIDDAKVMMSGEEIIDISEVKLLGEHNLQNICAALTAVWQVTQDKDAIRRVLSTFSGLEHRLELAGEVDGVRYIDDSFGTTPDTATVAMKAFEQPKIMILGGADKGIPFDELARAVSQSNVKHAIVIGQVADKIINSLHAAGFTDITSGLTTMPEIVAKARQIAQPGDVVLLSAATSSFGLFKDYKDRGNQFKSAVNSLRS